MKNIIITLAIALTSLTFACNNNKEDLPQPTSSFNDDLRIRLDSACFFYYYSTVNQYNFNEYYKEKYNGQPPFMVKVEYKHRVYAGHFSYDDYNSESIRNEYLNWLYTEGHLLNPDSPLPTECFYFRK